MDIQIQSRNVELNPEAHDYIRKKFDRLQRHLRRMSDAKIEVSRTSARAQADKIIVQMTVTAGGSTLRGQESGVNLFAAVDAVADVLDRQIRRLKGRVYRTPRPARPRVAPRPRLTSPSWRTIWTSRTTRTWSCTRSWEEWCAPSASR